MATNKATKKPREKRVIKGGKIRLPTKEELKKTADDIYKTITSKEAQNIGKGTLMALILAGLGTAGYAINKRNKEIKNLKQRLEDEGIGEEIIQEFGDLSKVAYVKDKKRVEEKIENAIRQEEHILDTLEDKVIKNVKKAIHRPRTHSMGSEESESPYYEAQESPNINIDLQELEKKFHEDFNNAMSDIEGYTRSPFDEIPPIENEIDLSKTDSGGLNGGSLKSMGDKIYKIITSKEAKNMGKSALIALVLAGLGTGAKHIHDKSHRKMADKKYIESLKSDWEDLELKNEKYPSYFASGLKEGTQQYLKDTSKKIAELIEYAKKKGLDKAALFALVTALLSVAGYGAFLGLSARAKKEEEEEMPKWMTPEAKKIIDDFVRADNPVYPEEWNPNRIAEKLLRAKAKGLKGGNVGSKINQYVKLKTDEYLKPAAKKITDALTSDTAKSIGKAALQTAILGALTGLTAYAGKKMGDVVGQQSRAIYNRYYPSEPPPEVPTNVEAPRTPPKKEMTEEQKEKIAEEIYDTMLNEIMSELKTSDKDLKREIQDNWARVPENAKIDYLKSYVDPTKIKRESLKQTIITPALRYGDTVKDYLRTLSSKERKKHKNELSDEQQRESIARYLFPEEPASEASEQKKSPAKKSPKKAKKEKAASEEEKKEGTGLKEDVEKFGKQSKDAVANTANKFYNFITSKDIQDMGKGVTVGVIVTALGLLMGDAYRQHKGKKIKKSQEAQTEDPFEKIINESPMF